MPLYEYACEHCGNRFEQIVKFSDPPVETCPKCGSGPVHKLMSSPAIQFKGSGWYITDYARKDGTKSDGGSPAKTDSSKGSDATSSDAKPETKSEPKTESKTETKPTTP